MVRQSNLAFLSLTGKEGNRFLAVEENKASTPVAELTVLYEDDHLLIVDKPAGLLVHRTRIAQDRTTCVELLEAQRGGRFFPGHRIDRGTSGVVVFSRDAETAGRLMEAFAAQAVRKTYRAVVRGWILEADEIDYAVRTSVDGPRKDAVSVYRPLGRIELPHPLGEHPTVRYTLVEVAPQTGRWHQIRQHMKHLNHPVIGDTRHGDARHNRLWRAEYGVHRMLLHAERIVLPHPVTGAELTVTAPFDADFARVLRDFPWAL